MVAEGFTMADQQLPAVLRMLRISIDPTGEVTARYPRTDGALRQPAGVLRDSLGRSYLLFENGRDKQTTFGFALRRPRGRWDRVLIPVLWSLGAASVIVATWCGIVLFTS
jgi:hypothetical protein